MPRSIRHVINSGGFNGSVQVNSEDERQLLDKKTSSKRRIVFVAIFSFGVVFGRVATFASTPLWIDSTKPVAELTNASLTNSSWSYRIPQNLKRSLNKVHEHHSVVSVIQDSTEDISFWNYQNGSSKNITLHKTNFVSPYYVVLAQQLLCTIVFGLSLITTYLVAPSKITDTESRYPKWRFFVIGFSMAASSLLVNSATSGSKTAPFLQAILMNFNVPITFAIRFLILRKRPTLRKLLCASVVVLTEFVCMIPTIFPSLESAADRRTEGGGTGTGRIVWPFIFVLSQVPYAIQSTVIEKVTKDQTGKKLPEPQSDSSAVPRAEQINMVYFLFWTSAFTFLSALLLFWSQLIPHFSDVSTLRDLGKQLWFNMECEFAGSSCSDYVTLVSSVSVLANLMATFSIANLLRWSEGANYMMVVSTIRTPVLFLFWTLFQEEPFRWYPHATLSTWLSVGAIFVMLPAVYAYSTGAPEHDPKRRIELEITAEDKPG